VPASATGPIEAVVFDLGGVLIDWNPRHLYRSLFPDDEAGMERFLDEVCSPAWNASQDAGRSWSEAIELLAAEHPEQRDLIVAYRERWGEMLAGPIQDTVEVLGELVAEGLPVYALSNWSAETFPIARQRFEFLSWFRAVVVSGEVRLVKPDVAIFRHLLDTFRLRPSATVFVDDSAANVAAAQGLGMIGIPFTNAADLRGDLRALGVLDG
jgi:2-haloacid dehalogenase